MVKTKPKTNTKSAEQPVTPKKKKEELTPEQQFMKDLNDTFKNIGTRMDNMQTQINASNKRSQTVAKKASEEPKGFDLKGIIDTVNSIFNSPVVEKIMEMATGGGAEETAAAPPPPAVDAQELKKVNAYYEKQVAFVDRMTEAIVAKAEAETKIAKKRAESDFY